MAQLSLAQVSPKILDILVLLRQLLVDFLKLYVTLWHLTGIHGALAAKVGCFQIDVLCRGHHLTGYRVIIVLDRLAVKGAPIEI